MAFFLLNIHLLIKEPDGASLIRQHTTPIYLYDDTSSAHIIYSHWRQKGIFSHYELKIMEFKA